jgi:hypothetical protein
MFQFSEHSFYSCMCKNYGLMSHKAFALFWNKKFAECSQLIESINSSLGDPQLLGIDLILMHHHCKRMILGGAGLSFTPNLPLPPSLNEITALIEYEESQEALVSKSASSILAQPEKIHKSILAASLGHAHSCSVAIETGTFLGATTYLFSGSYSQVYSIEADPDLFLSARSFLSHRLGINLFQGNSGVILKEVLDNISGRALIFLDAHYSTGITSNLYGESPLEDELRLLLDTDHLIIIDDARHMQKTGYPGIHKIASLVPARRSMTIRHDQIIIPPP